VAESDVVRHARRGNSPVAEYPKIVVTPERPPSFRQTTSTPWPTKLRLPGSLPPNSGFTGTPSAAASAEAMVTAYLNLYRTNDRTIEMRRDP